MGQSWYFWIAVAVATVIGGRLLASSVRTGERLVHPEPEEPGGWQGMSMEEMNDTLTPDQLAAEDAYERELRERERAEGAPDP